MDSQENSVAEYELTNRSGCKVRFLNLGGIITRIEVPDRNGSLANVVLSYDNTAEYLTDTAYLGAIVGRYANRIAGARFTLDDVEYRLPANNGPNTLHGGTPGFEKAVWNVDVRQDRDEAHAILRHVSEDGDQGFPGTLEVSATYTLTSENELIVMFEASTSKPTHVNLSQHTYFNLSGDPRRDILSHELSLNASRFTVADGTQIPTGELRQVAGTPFDFRSSTSIGSRIDADDQQLAIGHGFDQNFVIDRDDEGSLAHAATLRDPSSGRVMDVLTTEPGIQVYTGNHLVRHPKRSGIALETQHYPDSPNHPEFPSTVLRRGERYFSQTVFRFSVD
jgi:aldose 1-epimerase